MRALRPWSSDTSCSRWSPDAVRVQTCLVFFRKRLPYAEELSTVREDHLRVLNPTPYKVSVTEKLYEFMMELIDANAPLNVLS